MSKTKSQQLEAQKGLESRETAKQPDAVPHYGPDGKPIETTTSQQGQEGGTGEAGGGGSLQ